MKINLFVPTVLAAVCLTTTLANAQTEPTAIRLRIGEADAHASSLAQIRRLHARLDDAVLEACGASPFSVSGFKDATRRGDCYRKSLAAAVGRIGNPELAAAFAREKFGQSPTYDYAGRPAGDANVQ